MFWPRLLAPFHICPGHSHSDRDHDWGISLDKIDIKMSISLVTVKSKPIQEMKMTHFEKKGKKNSPTCTRPNQPQIRHLGSQNELHDIRYCSK